ncbi:MAG: hypothetical protein Q9224_000484 [Gallowayella concinna]
MASGSTVSLLAVAAINACSVSILTSSMQVAVPMQFVPRDVAAGTKRPRSNTSGSTASSRRTKSRASTTSIASSGTQPLYPEPSHALLIQHAPQLQYSAEEMITRSEHQLTNPQTGYTFDPSLQRHGEYPGNIHMHARSASLGQSSHTNPSNRRPPLNHHQSFDGKDTSGLEPANGDQGAEENTDGRKKKGSATSLANDLELNKLFQENKHRSLKEVAAQVLANERGPRSEKTKQIFAMLW